jgi:predicted nucleic acid-binding protein
MTVLVLDSGALIALERRDLRMVKLVEKVTANRLPTYLPAGVLAQVWRGSSRQQPVSRFLGDRSVRVEPMTEEVARNIGRLLAAAGTNDVFDGHVALLAHGRKAAVITSDPKDLHILDPGLELIVV